jgi:hypothetical protein
LLAVTEFLGLSPVNLRSVTSLKDLIDYLRTECLWEEYTGALANYLENEFDVDSFDALNIDKAMLAKPDFWRALAVLLNVPIKMPVEKVRDPDGWANTAEFSKES